MNGPSETGPIDAEQLGRLLVELGPALALYAAQWTEAADDCVQGALVELARQPVVPQNMRAWLYRVVKHRALNAARSTRRRRERESRIARERLMATDSSSLDRADVMAVIEALDQLSVDERELVIMRIWGALHSIRGNVHRSRTINKHRAPTISSGIGKTSSDSGAVMFDKDSKQPPEHPLSAELAAVEKRLAELTPAPPRVDRDRLMYAAGKAAAFANDSRPRWPGCIAEPSWLGLRFWQGATALATAATVLLGTMLAWQQRPRDVATKPQAAVVVESKANVVGSGVVGNFAANRALSAWLGPTQRGYLGARYVALTRGVDALECESAAPRDAPRVLSPPATAANLLDELVPKTKRTRS